MVIQNVFRGGRVDWGGKNNVLEGIFIPKEMRTEGGWRGWGR